MSDEHRPLGVDPALRRRNILLGLAVGGFALAILIIALIQFTTGGLPKGESAWTRSQQRQSAEAPDEGGGATP